MYSQWLGLKLIESEHLKIPQRQTDKQLHRAAPFSWMSAAAAALCLSAHTVSLFSLCDVQCSPGLWQIETVLYWSMRQARLNTSSTRCLQPSFFLTFFFPPIHASLSSASLAEPAAITNIFLSLPPSLHSSFSPWTYKLRLFSFLFSSIPSSLLPFISPVYLFFILPSLYISSLQHPSIPYSHFLYLLLSPLYINLSSPVPASLFPHLTSS